MNLFSLARLSGTRSPHRVEELFFENVAGGGVGSGKCSMTMSSVAIDELNVVGVSVFPGEANSILVVNTNRVLSCPVISRDGTLTIHQRPSDSATLS